MKRQIAASALLTMLAAAPAMAEDRAVVIAQTAYAGTPAPAVDVNGLTTRLRAAGMTTTVAADLVAGALPGPLEVLQAPDPAAGARLVVLSGQFVNAGGDSWLLAVDAGARGLAHADRDGISVGHVVTLMRDGGRRGILLLAEAPGGPPRGPRLGPGVGPMRGVAGVSVIAGPPDAITRAALGLTGGLAGPQSSLAAVLLSEPALRLVSGAATATLEGVPPINAPASAEPEGAGTLSTPALPGEAEAWVLAAAQASVGSYQDFLSAFPGGRYAGVARERITQLGGTPPAPTAPASVPGPASDTASGPQAMPPAGALAHAAVTEMTLNLSLGERSQMQRILTGLGHDTGGTDGAFGSATRAAIRGWQADAGLPVTGYLDADQTARLRRGAR